MKKTVALIFGGEGMEREISELSARNLYSLIDKEKYTVVGIYINENGEWYILDSFSEKYIHEKIHAAQNRIPTFPILLNKTSGFLTRDGIMKVDCALPCLHGDFGEDGTVQGALTLAHIPYIGQDVYASALTSDKIYTKLAAEHLGIPTAKWIADDGTDAEKAKERCADIIGYPAFIKPARSGSSYGAHPVFSSREFDTAYAEAKKIDTRILIEQLIPFEYELECALFDDGTRRIIPGGKIISGGAFYDYASKYTRELSPKTDVKTANFSGAVESAVIKYTDSLANTIGIRHLSRFDFSITKNSEIYFNEINSFPGMTKTSLYPRLVSGIGSGEGDFITLLIEKVCSNDRRI